MAKRSGQAGTVVRKGNQWHIRYLHDTPLGRVRKSVRLGDVEQLTKTQAKRLGAQWLHDQGINTSVHAENLDAVPMFDSALQKWKDARLAGFKPSGKATSKYVVARHIEPRFKGILLEQVDKQAVQLWINDLSASGLAPKTVSNVVKLLKSILNWSEVGTRDWKLRLPEIPEDEQRWFTSEEVEKLIEAATGQYKVLFRLAYASGMRAGELFGLHADDFNFEAGTVRVERSTFRNIETPPKSRKARRTVYLDSGTLEAVRTLLAGRTSGSLTTLEGRTHNALDTLGHEQEAGGRDAGGAGRASVPHRPYPWHPLAGLPAATLAGLGLASRVFQTKNGTPLKASEVGRWVLGPLCKKLRIPHGGMHAFRHGRVSRMQDAGVNEKLIQTEIGHSSLRMTRRYTHFTDDQRRMLAEKLSASLSQIVPNHSCSGKIKVAL